MMVAPFSTTASTNCISSDEPAKGQLGTRVTIEGTDLLGGFDGSDIVEVTLAGVEAVISENNDTHVVVVVKNGTGSGDIVITSNTGAQAVRESGWSFLTLGEISNINPAVGQGGSRVTVTGSNLLGGGSKVYRITFADVEASVVSESDDAIVVDVAHTNNDEDLTGEVLIESDTGALVKLNDSWTYAVPGRIDQVVPAAGQLGTSVTINGTSLRGQGAEIVKVTLAGTEVTIEAESDTEIELTVVHADAASGRAKRYTGKRKEVRGAD